MTLWVGWATDAIPSTIAFLGLDPRTARRLCRIESGPRVKPEGSGYVMEGMGAGEPWSWGNIESHPPDSPSPYQGEARRG
ncbi:hypothetical protein GCM10007913_20170 [Devosia yakushimensis]|uniref:Uncharacterized protein n=1 Tax=Devosia yakushimensis TaxID=470028 RepID=A0ABQ5UED2_9HYPH|nr:hypothetical protein GCM10007913_20170 [Devosia yakushimensis]